MIGEVELYLIMDKLLELIKKADRIFVCGNGGSAANAEHFTNDLFSKGINAYCLNSNVSILTMIANDFGYKHVFSKQLENYASSTDLLVTISCSGKSPNVIEAVKMAKKLKMDIYQFEKFKGRDKDYGELENKHLELIHQIRSLL